METKKEYVKKMDGLEVNQNAYIQNVQTHLLFYMERYKVLVTDSSLKTHLDQNFFTNVMKVSDQLEVLPENVSLEENGQVTSRSANLWIVESLKRLKMVHMT